MRFKFHIHIISNKCIVKFIRSYKNEQLSCGSVSALFTAQRLESLTAECLGSNDESLARRVDYLLLEKNYLAVVLKKAAIHYPSRLVLTNKYLSQLKSSMPADAAMANGRCRTKRSSM